MWIFGYGSLTWKVDFPYRQREVGYIKGYVRRFWQASIDHRGVPGKAQVWGVAYEVPPEQEADVTKRLNVREQRFDNRKTVVMYGPSGHPLSHSVLVFVGSNEPELFLGDAPLQTMAEQIGRSHGPSGANSDYLFQLARFMRNEVPQAQDDHLFQLEAAVNEFLTKSRKIVHTHHHHSKH
ncbi:putative glutathione-specific gamma-glutamylcyclotransferase 2 isoform X2 [Cherax quadricarinatus]|uniref:putative glutathione-specific gamma-glutamylcyclotransferase 2 isoform X2 n=1 Tax=Cherax quadricarinatus TaxID=27406 RepID=UPI00387E37EA